MPDRLTDTELRSAAARRPGYATYPEYAPAGPERLGRLPVVERLRAPGTPARWPEGDMWSSPSRQRPLGPVPAAAEPVSALDARPAKPAAAPAATALVDLPETRVFDFQPTRITSRPWWRRRWHWGVIAAGAKTRHGYTWTEAGARRRTDRAARQAAR